MKIVIKTTDFQLDNKIKDFVEGEMNSLEKFIKNLYNQKDSLDFLGKGKPKIEAWVEIGKETSHHRKGPFSYVECQIRLPGKSIRSEAVGKNFKLAINEVKDELQRELKEYKEKITTKRKRGA